MFSETFNEASELNDLDRVYHLIISEGGSPEKYAYHLAKRYREILKQHDKSPDRYAFAERDMATNYAGIWQNVKEYVMQIVRNQIDDERTEAVLKKSSELFLKDHVCHTDEIWYLEDRQGNPIGSKPRCPDCVHVKDMLNRIYKKRKY